MDKKNILSESQIKGIIRKKIENVLKESFQPNSDYTHYAVNKTTKKIVNGWDYNGYDSEDLKQFKQYYFTQDLLDYELDPKQYSILTRKFLLKNGIDPDDWANWANS